MSDHEQHRRDLAASITDGMFKIAIVSILTELAERNAPRELIMPALRRGLDHTKAAIKRTMREVAPPTSEEEMVAVCARIATAVEAAAVEAVAATLEAAGQGAPPPPAHAAADPADAPEVAAMLAAIAAGHKPKGEA